MTAPGLPVTFRGRCPWRRGIRGHAPRLSLVAKLAPRRIRRRCGRIAGHSHLSGDRDRRLLLFVNLDAMPAAERAAGRAAQPRRHPSRTPFGSALITVGVWQAVIFIRPRGWPLNTITRRPAAARGQRRRHRPGRTDLPRPPKPGALQPDAISAHAGNSSRHDHRGNAFEGWARRHGSPRTGSAQSPWPSRPASRRTRPPPNRPTPADPLARDTPRVAHHRSLAFIGAGIILHVGIGPLAIRRKTTQQNP